MTLNVYPPEIDHIDKKFIIDERFIYKNLERLFSPGPISGIFNTINSVLSPVRVESIDAKKGIQFKLIDSLSKANPVLSADNNMFIACLETGKLQFSISNLSFLGNGFLHCNIPSQVILIQRRENFRVPAPPDRNFKALIHFSVGKEMIGDIVDISDNGLQLDLRLGATELEVGKVWPGCSLERLQARSAKFDLVIRNVRPSPTEQSRIRVGCELFEPTKLNLNEFLSTRSAIQTSRVNRRINYWYQEVNWC